MASRGVVSERSCHARQEMFGGRSLVYIWRAIFRIKNGLNARVWLMVIFKDLEIIKNVFSTGIMAMVHQCQNQKRKR